MSPAGFMVLSIDTEFFSKTRSLLLWIAHVHETGKHNWVKHVQWIEQVAKATECSHIKTKSVVPELEKYCLKNGWLLTQKEYMREV